MWVNAFLVCIVWITTTTKISGYLNFSQAKENSIWIARRAKVKNYLARILILNHLLGSEEWFVNAVCTGILRVMYFHILHIWGLFWLLAASHWNSVKSNSKHSKNSNKTYTNNTHLKFIFYFIPKVKNF